MGPVATLIEVVAYDPVAAVTKTRRFTNRNDPRATSWNNLQWKPILQKSPAIGLSVFNGDFTGFGQTTIDSFIISLIDVENDELASFVWHGATVKIYAGDLETQAYTLRFTAVGDGADRRGSLELEVMLKTRDELLNRPLLFYSYAGTGDIEGVTDIIGVEKPFVIGDAKYCKPVLIDPVRQIYQVHGYGPVESIYGCFEGGLAIGTGGNPATSYTLAAGHTYTTIKDVVVAQGQWVRFNDLGLIKLGSQPSFPVTVHVKGDNGGIAANPCLKKAGDIVKRLINLTVSNVTVKAASITALNTAQVQVLDKYYENQVNVNDAVAECLRSVGAYWAWNELGEVILGRMRFGTSSMTLSAKNDRLPDVMGVSQLKTHAPVWSLRLGAEACHFVHDSSSVVQALVDIDTRMDTFDSSKNRIFPISTVAPTGAVDGDLWPDSSVTPLVLRRYNGGTSTWVAAGAYGASVGSTLYLASGTAPTQAQVITSEGTAAAIAGQAATATSSDFAVVTGLTRPANYATVNIVSFSATAPTSPVNGDIWVDTSVSPYLVKVRVAGAWQIGGNYSTNTNQLTDGAGLGTTALWTGVTGTAKPADYATKNIVSYGATAPTSPTLGDIWVRNDLNPVVVRTYNGTAWVDSGNYTINTNQLTDGALLGQTALWTGVTGVAKPADYATVNVVSYSTAAPTSPVNGDIWVDTSVTPYLVKVRVAGAWQIGGNYSTNTNQLTDGALLGQTALWTSVTGVAKPSDYAGTTIPNLIRGGLATTTNLTIAGNSLTQINSMSSWNGWVYSNLGYIGSARVSGRFIGSAGNGPIFGLVTPAQKNTTNYTTIAYGFFNGSSNIYYMEAGGYAIIADSGTWTSDDVFTIDYDGSTVRYFKNDVLLRGPISATAGQTYHFKAVFDTGAITMADLQFIGGGIRPRLGSTIESSAGSVLSDAAVITAQGVAASIASQGSLATLSSVNLDSQVVDGSTYARYQLTERSKLTGVETGANVTETRTSADFTGRASYAKKDYFQLGLTGVVAAGSSGSGLTEGGAEWTTNVLLRTPSGIASAIAGQGSYATLSSVAYGSSYLTGFGTLAPRSNVDWDTASHIIGLKKPVDHAGSIGLLKPIGTQSTVRGNTVMKSTGTHGAWEGGAVGEPQYGSCFISCSILSAVGGDGWYTTIGLDTSETNFNPSSSPYYAFYIAGGGSGNVYLYKNNVFIGSAAVPNVTVDSRLAMIYDEVSVGVYVNGIRYVETQAVAAGQKLYPKIFDYYLSGVYMPPGSYDIQYGPAYLRGDLNAGFVDTGAASPLARVIRGDIRTALGTAAAIAGQAATATNADFAAVTGATKPANNATVGATYGVNAYSFGSMAGISSAAYGSSYLTGFGPMAPLDRARFMSGNGGIADEANSYWITNAIAVTSQGTAAAIANQGALATLGSVNLDSQVAEGTTYKRYQLAEQTKMTGIEAGANVTETRTAAAISGQAYYATRNYFQLGLSGAGSGGSGAGLTEGGAEWTTNALLRTPSGTAAAITSQGALATLGSVDLEGATVTNKGRLNRLSAATGNALSTFTSSDGRTFSKIAESLASRDGDVVTFAATLPSVPKMSFLPGGNGATAGQNIQIVAVGLTVSGFTMKAKSQAVTAGSTITDTTTVTPGGGEPTSIIDRSNSGAPYDGKFKFNISVTVGELAPGEPGNINIAVFVKQSGAWVQAGNGSRISSGTLVITVTPGTVDFGAGGEFGASVNSTSGSGTMMNGITSVVYTLGTVTETSLTPTGASDIPWLALLQ